ncbi:acyl-CoA dehydrogenase [Streptomyces sp. NPDC007088]|uniref:acyl-CoA dehydrogenase n=1 Tax=Streptomyces sp. NPDC007088 TaxID=3364773 RepID=UPI0036C049EE
MRFLDQERAAAERLLPGLDAALARHPLRELESCPSPGIAAFRASGGPGLLVPRRYGGLGASPLDAVRVQRAVGARSPSLAVATTMHHFSVAGLVHAVRDDGGAPGPEGLLLASVAAERLLLASAFAEGRTGQNILRPHVVARRRNGRVVLNGSKMPCSLSRSMDLLTVSVVLPDEEGPGPRGRGPAAPGRLAVALVPAGTPGVEVLPFWGSPLLAGAESEQVVLRDVEIDPQQVVTTEVTADAVPDDLHLAGFLWFELLLTAGYVGVASALVERVLRRSGPPADPTVLVTGVEAAALSLEAVARAMETEEWTDTLLAGVLAARYAAQDTIARTTRDCLAALGGMAFAAEPDGSYLASAAGALTFHPPARGRMARPLGDYLDGRPLRIG